MLEVMDSGQITAYIGFSFRNFRFCRHRFKSQCSRNWGANQLPTTMTKICKGRIPFFAHESINKYSRRQQLVLIDSLFRGSNRAAVKMSSVPCWILDSDMKFARWKLKIWHNWQSIKNACVSNTVIHVCFSDTVDTTQQIIRIKESNGQKP